MALDRTALLQQVLCDAFADLWDGGSLLIYTGSPPGAGNAPTGTLLVDITVPTPAYGSASGSDPASAAKNGTWEDAAADGAGDAGYFRLIQSGDANGAGADGTEERIEGTVTATSGGGDIELDNITIAVGQTVTITSLPATHT